MPKRSSKPHSDPNLAAFDAIARLTGDEGPTDLQALRRQAAAILGSLGGKRGGPARAAKLSRNPSKLSLMPDLTKQQWGEVRRAYTGNTESVRAIAGRFGIARWDLHHRAKAEGCTGCLVQR